MITPSCVFTVKIITTLNILAAYHSLSLSLTLHWSAKGQRKPKAAWFRCLLWSHMNQLPLALWLGRQLSCWHTPSVLLFWCKESEFDTLMHHCMKLESFVTFGSHLTSKRQSSVCPSISGICSDGVCKQYDTHAMQLTTLPFKSLINTYI